MAMAMTLLVASVAVVCGATPERFFKVDEVEQMLPLPSKSWPENLRVILWMDQGGAFGHSDVPMSAPDLALSFGDSATVLDTKTRSFRLDVAGPSWTWMNRWDAYLAYFAIKKIGFHYLFEWNEDYTFTQIYPSLDLGGLGTYSLPKWLMSFTMVRQTPPEDGSCPPSAAALPRERSRCAHWDRVSSGLLSPLLGSYGIIHYYAYNIVDGEGKRIQPYYDAYLAFARQSSDPGPFTAGKLGIDLGAVGSKSGTSFTGGKSDMTAPTKHTEL